EEILTKANVFCYGQVKSAYGSGQFIKDLAEAFPDEEKIILSEINSRDEILPSIKTFLGKGR
ncbi:MAG: stress response protein, partial [Planctomycetes bacterium]|nr:stress response protein [Planctomycetota bacterium]